MITKSTEWEAAQRKNLRQLAYWTGAWCLTMTLPAFGPKFIWDFNPVFSILTIVLNMLVGVGMIVMHRKYTNGLDEMQRKIFMEAKALALGVGVVGGLSYSLLDTARVIPFDAEISFVVLLMGLTYSIASIVGCMRYK